jgi:ABC-type lipoprotein release transport system permease subunit
MAWRNLWRNRRRTLLTLSTIVFGVFLSIIMESMQDRNWEDMIRLAARLGGGHVTLQHPEYMDTPTLSRSVRNTESLVRYAKSNDHVTRVVPRITGFNMLSTAGENQGAGFLAIAPELEDEDTLSLLEAVTEGEFFGSSMDEGIILGSRLARNLGVEIGSKLVYTMTDKNGEIVSQLARVRALLTTGSPTVDGGLCLLPIGTVRELLGFGPDESIQIAAFVDDQRNSESVAADLATVLSDDVSAVPWFELQPDLAGFIAMKVGGAKFVMLLLAVLVAAGIFNTLFVGVMERLREFGIMLAIGFSPGKLFQLVMTESLWLAVVGLAGAAVVTTPVYLYLASTGIDVSALLPEGNTEIAGVGFSTIMKVGIYGENLFLIVGSALVAVMLSGLYPAWKAGHADPVETIRLV